MNINCFNHSIETAREWMRDLMDVMETEDDGFACRALRATLHELRDHLTIQESAQLSAQLPLLLKGIFYDGWNPTGKPSKERSKAEFLDRVGASFPDRRIDQIEYIVSDVFEFLSRKVSHGEINHVVSSLPKEIRAIWPGISEESTLRRVV